ncbi:SET domain-containing protein [Apiospora marii]|uniref:SET domain-containing protein n=1 Tax=Apiospora marii TaxID=335849 RepID=A0ABR1R546_9PEZI
MEAAHPYRKLKIPEDAPFELKPTPGKGWGMFATRDIEDNEIILQEMPLFTIPELSVPRPLEEEVRLEVEELDEEDQEQFFSLRRNGSEPFDTLEAAFRANKFDLSGTDYPDDEALLLLMSRFNHSCTPNAMVPNPSNFPDVEPECTTMVSAKPIPAGTEITFSYTNVTYYLRRDERRLALAFDCKCEACNVEDPNEVYMSDLRRTLLRGLDSLVNMGLSKGAEDVIDTETNPIIIDPGLRAAAANCQIMHSTRFICYTMIPCVLEAEGNLGLFTSGIYCRDLEALATQFQSSENARIADLVLQQPYWLERLNAAFRLWNRTDDGDMENAAASREELRIIAEPSDLAGIWQGELVTTPIIEEVD